MRTIPPHSPRTASAAAASSSAASRAASPPAWPAWLSQAQFSKPFHHFGGSPAGLCCCRFVVCASLVELLTGLRWGSPGLSLGSSGSAWDPTDGAPEGPPPSQGTIPSQSPTYPCPVKRQECSTDSDSSFQNTDLPNSHHFSTKEENSELSASPSPKHTFFWLGSKRFELPLWLLSQSSVFLSVLQLI